VFPTQKKLEFHQKYSQVHESNQKKHDNKDSDEAAAAAAAAAAQLANAKAEEQEIISGSHLIYQGTKSFWRTNSSLDIWCYATPKADCVTILPMDGASQQPLPTKYLRLSTLTALVSDRVAAELTKERNSRPPLSAAVLENRMSAHANRLVASYILGHLEQTVPGDGDASAALAESASAPADLSGAKSKLTAAQALDKEVNPTPGGIGWEIVKLADDTWDTLEMEPPQDFAKHLAGPSARITSTEGERKALIAGLENERSALRRASTHAARMQKNVEMAMRMFGGMAADRARMQQYSKQGQKWLKIARREIIRREIDIARVVLGYPPLPPRMAQANQA
jgi:hypothetical protein